VECERARTEPRAPPLPLLRAAECEPSADLVELGAGETAVGGGATPAGVWGSRVQD
jgi:hypothetical protein